MALKLTPEQPETHGCVFSTVATDVQMLHVVLLSSADQMSFALDQSFGQEYCMFTDQH